MRTLLAVLLVYVSVVDAKEWLSESNFYQKFYSGESTQDDLVLLLNHPKPGTTALALRRIERSEKLLESINARQVLRTIWNEDYTGFKNLDLDRVSHPVIRLALVEILSSIDPVHKNEYRSYAISQLKSNWVINEAILALGQSGRPEDIDILLKYSKMDNGEYLTATVWAIFGLGLSNAEKILDDLRGEFPQDSLQRAQIDQLLECCKPNNTNSVDAEHPPF